MKKLFLDCETTGLDPVKNGIIQLSAIVEIDGKFCEEIDLHFRPFVADVIDPKALEVNGKTVAELKSIKRMGPKPAFMEFTKSLENYVDPFDSTDKFTVYAYNAPFDINFVAEWFKKNNNPYWGSWQDYRPVDVLAIVRYMSSLRFDKIWDLPGVGLEKICTAYGIKIEKAHDAMHDVEALYKLWQKVEYDLPRAMQNDGLWPQVGE